jgi:hypothetical protein
LQLLVPHGLAAATTARATTAGIMGDITAGIMAAITMVITMAAMEDGERDWA